MQAMEDREQIEMFISCRSLRDMDVMSKSDPVVILMVQNQQGQWTEWARTEQIDNNLNPDFATSFCMDFIFEQQQHLMFKCIDIDGPNDFDFIGSCQTTLSNIVGSRGSMVVMDLMNKTMKCGKIIIRAEKTGYSNDLFQCTPCTDNVTSQRWFSDTKPFLRIIKSTENNQNIKVYESNQMRGLKFNRMPTLSIKMSKLCNEDKLRPLTLEMWDYHSDGSHKIIGTTKFSVQQAQDQAARGRVELVIKNKDGKKQGNVYFENLKVLQRPSFVSYLRGGTELQLIGAVDFTGSNGAVSAPSSLHYINHSNPNHKNMYQQALLSIGDILINYDHTKMVPMFGFGGKPLPLSTKTMHCFPMNFSPQEPRNFGLQGIMQAYRNSLPQIELSGPTLFSPLLKEVNSLCQSALGTNKYFILLILTDGAIHDMDETIDQIFVAQDLPLSIIIVGLGNADFSLMETLDGDDGLYDRNGHLCRRDLVQFVPYNKFKTNPSSLAKEVLEELPDQLVQFYMSKGISPGTALQQDINTLNLAPIDNIEGAAQMMAGNPNFLDQLINQQMPPHQ